MIVVGAGVTGLSCAVRLAEAGYDVHVLARDLPAETTSAVAGALWFPYRAAPAADVARWARVTLAELARLAGDDASGVRRREGVLLHRSPPARPEWADAMADLVELRDVVDPAPGYPHGLALRVPLVDMTRYLPWLVARLERAGGTVTRMPLPALPEHGTVVDATGVAARAMAGDPRVHPVRGQVVLVRAAGVDRWLVDETEVDGELLYVLPRQDCVVVGGTATEGDWDPVPDPATARRLLDRAAAVEPRLAGAAVLGHRVGLRPARDAVRLETEHRPDGGATVHCYGHGGAGVTLSWGCADDVLSEVSGVAAP